MAEDSLADSGKDYVIQPRIPAQKACSRCGQIKPAGAFVAYRYTTKQGKISARLDSECKECTKAQRVLNHERENGRQRRRRHANPEVLARWKESRRKAGKPAVEQKQCSKCGAVKEARLFYGKAISADGLGSQCRTCLRKIERERQATLEPARRATASYRSHLKFRYGMAFAEYEALALSQEGHCASCGKGDVLLYVDHSHKTGKIRGLLCHGCNTAIGMAHDDSSALRAMADYVDRNE